MITIKITRTVETPFEVTENFIVTRKPTPIKAKESQYGDEKTLYDETYAPSVAKKVKTQTIELLEQNIENESTFDLAAVIKAVNSL